MKSFSYYKKNFVNLSKIDLLTIFFYYYKHVSFLAFENFNNNWKFYGIEL